jgi:hypothetical protein
VGTAAAAAATRNLLLLLLVVLLQGCSFAPGWCCAALLQGLLCVQHVVLLLGLAGAG